MKELYKQNLIRQKSSISLQNLKFNNLLYIRKNKKKKNQYTQQKK